MKTRDYLEPFVRESSSFTEALRKMGRKPVGGSITNLNLMCRRLNIDTSHMTGCAHRKSKHAANRLSASEILVEGKPTDHRRDAEKLRRALTEIGVECKCVECGMIDEWNGKPITLEIDHKDNRYWNNRRDNLRFMCPNCHSQRI